jgi:hypothetical protein
MIRVTSVTAKAPCVVHLPRRKSRTPVAPKQRDPAEQAAALQRSEAHYRRVRAAVDATFLMNGGRYL